MLPWLLVRVPSSAFNEFRAVSKAFSAASNEMIPWLDRLVGLRYSDNHQGTILAIWIMRIGRLLEQSAWKGSSVAVERRNS